MNSQSPTTGPDGKGRSETKVIYWNEPRKESNDDGRFIPLPSGSSEDREALQKLRLKLDMISDGKKMEDRLDVVDGFPAARKEWVAMIVEECMHTLAAGGLLDFSAEGRARSNSVREDDLACQKPRNPFIFRWLVVKIIQTVGVRSRRHRPCPTPSLFLFQVLGFVAVVLFHHEGSLSSNPEAFLPALVTLYVTVSSVLLTALVYVSYLDFLVVKNQHFLLVIS